MKPTHHSQRSLYPPQSLLTHLLKSGPDAAKNDTILHLQTLVVWINDDSRGW